MRYTPTLKLGHRLVTFVTMSVISAMFILFLGGTLSLQRLGQEYLHNSLKGIVNVLEQELQDPDAVHSLQKWMPKVLQASNIVEMELSSNSDVIYRYKDSFSRVDAVLIYTADYTLQPNKTLKPNQIYQIHFKAIPPYTGLSYSIQALWSITFAVAFVIVCLLLGLKWLKKQLYGSELLEERGRMLLAGRVEEYAVGDEKEWPYTASQALDRLIEELQDARQERSRFDTFIRSQTFLDQLTGTANRVLFDSKLEAALSESGSRGGILILRIEDWEHIDEQPEQGIANDFLISVGEALNNVTHSYSDIILSRYYRADFAIFAPNLSYKEVSNLAAHCLKQLEKLAPPLPLESENWVHIGVSLYREGDSQEQIIDEAETALKSAQLQGMNTWTRFQKQLTQDDERGNVRWRSLLDHALQPDRLYLFAQPCYLFDQFKQLSVDHLELFARIKEPGKGLIKSSRFNSVVESIGYETILDKAVIQAVVRHITHSDNSNSYSINLHVLPFAEKSFFKWFQYELLNLTGKQRAHLSFEFVEAHLVQHLDYMRPVARMISGLGCHVVVGQAGRSIVSTHYLKELSVAQLKLHRSLIKKIDQRQENQLFVRSLLGACTGLETQVIAVGVDNKREYDTMLELGVNGIQGRYLADEKQMLPQPKGEDDNTSQANYNKVQIGRRNRWRKAKK